MRPELGQCPELANPAVTQLRQLAQRLIGLAECQVEAGPSRPQEPERRWDSLVASQVERYRLPRGVEIPANDLRPERRKRNELDSMHWEPGMVVMLLA